MANTDSFINEVTEEVRRDRLFAVLRRWGWLAVVLVLLIVGGAAWNEWRKAEARAEAEARGDALLAALEANDPSGMLAALAADATVPQLYRDLATLKGAMLGAGETAPDARIAALEPLSAPGGAFRALALEQIALAQLEAGRRDEAIGTLTGLLGASDASAALQQRAAQLILALGGSLDAT